MKPCILVNVRQGSTEPNIMRLDVAYMILAGFSETSIYIYGPGSSVGIATGYGLDGPGSNPGGGEIFRTCPGRPWGPPSLLYNEYRVFPGSKERSGLDPSSAVVKKE